MKTIYLLLLLLSVSCTTPPERHCADFKTGHFEYTYEINGKKHTSTFTRTDNLEVDYNGKDIDSIAVRWINDCEYVLKTINPKTLAQKKAIHIKILSTHKNTYTFESKIINDPQQRKSRGTVTKTN
ncbi:MAG: hypothetical protein ACPG45_04170 [Flavobacteriaceae bacterium]